MNPEDELDIRQYVAALRRRLPIVLSAIAACVIAAAVVSVIQPKMYSASSKVVISAQQDIATGSAGALGDPNGLQTQMQTQIQVAESPVVKAAADAALGDRAKSVSNIAAAGVPNTRVLSITATSRSRSVAQAAADAYADAYLKSGQQNAVDRVLSVGQSVNDKRADLQKQIDAINAQIAAAPKAGAAAGLAKQRDALAAQIDLLQRQYDNAQASALVREAAAAPLARAELPKSPISPKPLRNIALALVLGALLGVGAALLVDRLDDRVRSGDQLTHWFPQLPQLGAIPKVADWKDHSQAKVISLLEPQSQAAEAYRGLRTSLEFLALEREAQVIAVTSATAGEGKSTTVANLAIILASSGKEVAIVGADLRRPRVHEFFGLSNDEGFTSTILSGQPVEKALQKVMLKEQTIQVLPTGPLPPNPAELLAGDAAAELFEELRDSADYVLIDSPPILPVADPLVLSKYADGILLVAGAGVVRKRHLEHSLELISHSTNTPVLGVLLNGAEGEAAYSTAYSYYSEEFEPRHLRRGRIAETFAKLTRSRPK